MQKIQEIMLLMEGVDQKMYKYVLNYATRVILKGKNGKLQN